MKILFCTNVFQIVENGPVKFARLLPKINELYPIHEIRILTEDIAETDATTFKINMPLFWRKSILSQYIRMWIYHRKAMKIRKSYPFDVLVYNHALVGFLSSLFFGKTVVMVNDDNNMEAFKHQLFTRNGLKRQTFRLAELITCKMARLTIVNSNYLRTKLISKYKLQNHKVILLYKGVEISEGVLLKRLDQTKPVRILFIKNDIRRGGIDVLAKAILGLKFNCEVTIVGNNPNDQLYLQQLFQSKNISKLSIKGKIGQLEVRSLLAESDVFCVPSHMEALGVANLEALAHGVPVVSTWVGGIPEATDGNNGAWLVGPNDAEQLLNALTQCIENEDLRTRKTTHGLKHVRKFSESAVLQNFIDILLNIKS